MCFSWVGVCCVARMTGPDLEEEKNNLVVQNAKNNKMLKDIEAHCISLVGGGPSKFSRCLLWQVG